MQKLNKNPGESCKSEAHCLKIFLGHHMVFLSPSGVFHALSEAPRARDSKLSFLVCELLNPTSISINSSCKSFFFLYLLIILNKGYLEGGGGCLMKFR